MFLPITEAVDDDERQAWTVRRERANATELRKMRVGRDSYKNRQLRSQAPGSFDKLA